MVIYLLTVLTVVIDVSKPYSVVVSLLVVAGSTVAI
jgi:hypothetical protein